MNETQITFQKNLEFLLARDKINKQELAVTLNVEPFSVYRWTNKAKLPRVETVVALCEYFDVSIDTMLKGDVNERVERQRTWWQRVRSK